MSNNCTDWIGCPQCGVRLDVEIDVERGCVAGTPVTCHRCAAKIFVEADVFPENGDHDEYQIDLNIRGVSYNLDITTPYARDFLSRGPDRMPMRRSKCQMCGRGTGGVMARELMDHGWRVVVEYPFIRAMCPDCRGV